MAERSSLLVSILLMKIVCGCAAVGKLFESVSLLTTRTLFIVFGVFMIISAINFVAPIVVPNMTIVLAKHQIEILIQINSTPFRDLNCFPSPPCWSPKRYIVFNQVDVESLNQSHQYKHGVTWRVFQRFRLSVFI